MSVCELRKRAHNDNYDNFASKLGYSRFINNACTVLINNLQESTYMYINYFA